jgi:hypothetical protein
MIISQNPISGFEYGLYAKVLRATILPSTYHLIFDVFKNKIHLYQVALAYNDYG